GAQRHLGDGDRRHDAVAHAAVRPRAPPRGTHPQGTVPVVMNVADDKQRVAAERAKRLKGFVGHTGWRYFALAMVIGGIGGFWFKPLRMAPGGVRGAAVFSPA